MSITKVAAVQAEPAWFDLEAGVSKVIALVQQAASNGAQLIGFPESFIPGYPASIWAKGFDPVFLTKFQKNCLSVTSPQYSKIRKAIRDIGTIWVVLAFTERDGQSMYEAQSIINPQGKVLLHRRKLKATGQERTIWGDAPADSLTSAVPASKEGPIIGCLNCWEHLQPLLKYHHITLGTQIHVASWPYMHSLAQGTPSQFSSEVQDTLSRSLAIEGQMFVIQSTQMIRLENAAAAGVEGTSWAKPGGGFTAIYGPSGNKMAECTNSEEETIIYADIDMDDIVTAKLMGDTTGHYSRPDLLSLMVCPPFTPESPTKVVKTGNDSSGYKLLSKIPDLED